MIQTWQSKGTAIGTPAPWYTRSGHCWGSIGSVSSDNARHAPKAWAIEYLVDGEWLSTAALAAHPKNSRKLGQKGIQARIDRLKQSGQNPAAQKMGQLLGKATVQLTWRHFTRSAERGVVGAAARVRSDG